MISSCPNGHSDCTMQETPAKRGGEGGCAAEHTPQREGRAGASAPGAHGAPSGDATKCQCLSAPSGCPSVCPSLPSPQGCAGCSPLGWQGRWEWGWECCMNPPGSPKSPSSHQGVPHEAGALFPAGNPGGGGGGCPGQAGTRGPCRGGTGWQKDPEISRLTRSAGASVTVMVVAAQGCAV